MLRFISEKIWYGNKEIPNYEITLECLEGMSERLRECYVANTYGYGGD